MGFGGSNGSSEATNSLPEITPILLWHVARTLRTVQATRKWYRVAHPAKAGIFSFKFQYARRKTGKAPLVCIVESLMTLFLLRSCVLYSARLGQVRKGVTVDLLGFRVMLCEFLSEWSGAFSSRSIKLETVQMLSTVITRFQSPRKCRITMDFAVAY